MHPSSASSRGALFQIFVAPTLNRTTGLPLGIRPPRHAALLRRAQPQARQIYKYAKVPVAQPLKIESAAHPLDEKIRFTHVHLVTAEDESLPPLRPIDEVLRSFDRSVSVLRQVSLSPEQWPVCKIYTKQSLLEVLRAREESKSKKTVGDTLKQVELAWAITDNDLGIKLRRIENFLEEGRRVEIMIARKRDGRMTTPEEDQSTLQKIRDAVDEVPGAKEYKETDGKLGVRMMLYYESKRIREDRREQDKAEKATSRVEKLKDRDKKKAEEKEKLEKRLARKQETEAERRRLSGISIEQ